MKTKIPASQPWTYETAPTSPQLSPFGITTRQLKSWVWAGKVSHAKVGNRVFFTDEHLDELVESLTVRAVR